MPHIMLGVSPSSQFAAQRALITCQGHRSICLGIGGGTLPALWASRFRQARMDCVDCDAAIVALSRRLLSLSAPVRR